MREVDFQRQVTDLAELYGWQWAHFRPAQTAKGWRTPVSGPLGKGFPDLVLAKAGRLIFAEIKTKRGRPSEDQAVVLMALKLAGAETYLWRPEDFDAIHHTLSQAQEAAA